MTTVTLPWPPKELSPNARVHWTVAHKAKMAYKSACHLLMLSDRRSIKGKKAFTVTFRPPDARRRDRDNCIAQFKTGQDMLSVFSCVDDRHFVMTYAFGDPVKGGAVIVEVTG